VPFLDRADHAVGAVFRRHPALVIAMRYDERLDGSVHRDAPVAGVIGARAAPQ
jgi:hypothetical protein